MVLRTVGWSILAVFVSATLMAAEPGAKKPAEKTKPAPQAKAKEPTPPKATEHRQPIGAVSPEAITRALEQPVVMEFVNTPFPDVVEYLRDCARIPILTDKKALDDVGVSDKSLVTMNLRGVKLRSALNLMLRQLDLTWMILDEVLLITTPEQADSVLETRIYPVADLVAVRDAQLRPYNDFGQLIDVINSTVRPTTWDSVGGVGSIAYVEAAGITVLVVSHTRTVHEDIEALLAEVRKAKQGGADATPPVRERPKPAQPRAMGPAQPQMPQPEAKPPAQSERN
jgi:hypothetical protein